MFVCGGISLEVLGVPFFGELIAFEDLEGPSIDEHIVPNDQVTRTKEFTVVFGVLVLTFFEELTIGDAFIIFQGGLPELRTVGS